MCISNIHIVCIFQEKAAKYWVSKGTPKNKLNIGIATYGRSFVLADPANDFSVGAPVSGPGPQGTYTQEIGFYSYYEVSYNLVDSWMKSQRKCIFLIYHNVNCLNKDFLTK
jgi:GH18 family chitinase